MEKRRWNDDLEVEERKTEDQARLAERWQYCVFVVGIVFWFSLFFSPGKVSCLIILPCVHCNIWYFGYMWYI